MTFIPFDKSVLPKIEKLINIHFSLPILYDLSGGNFETFFENAIDGKREARKLLFDVVKDGIGWSLKKKETTSNIKFDVVLMRSDLEKDGII